MKLLLNMEESLISDDQLTVVHFVETSPSLLREMPWITLKEYKVSLTPSLLLFPPSFPSSSSSLPLLSSLL